MFETAMYRFAILRRGLLINRQGQTIRRIVARRAVVINMWRDRSIHLELQGGATRAVWIDSLSVCSIGAASALTR
jgi:hypothetical protein